MDTGVLRSFTYPDADVPPPPPDSEPEGSTISFDLLDCRWEWPGRFAYDISWSPPDDLELPATMPLYIGRSQGDQGNGTRVDAVLVGPGEFTLVLDDADWNRADDDTESSDGQQWGSSASDATSGIGDQCSLDVTTDHPTEIAHPYREIRQAGVRPSIDAPDGTVEQLLGLIDPSDPDDPLLAVADLFNDSGWPEVDRLWIAPTRQLLSLGISQEGSCVSVDSSYPVGADSTVSVSQRRSCPPSPRESNHRDRVVGLTDDVWEVHVVGKPDAIEELISQLSVLPFANVEPLAPTAFDSDEYLDAWYDDNPDNIEVGRSGWNGGSVSAYLVHGQDATRIEHNTLVVLPDERPTSAVPGAGSTGTACIDHSTWMSASPHLGVITVVTSDKVASAAYRDGDWIDIPLSEPVDGYRFGFVGEPPLPTQSNVSNPPEMRFRAADGAEIPCIQ